MRALKNFPKPIQNSRGMLSAEFLFALVISASMCMVLFALNFSLSMAEVAQYIAFSSARAHAAGQWSQEEQTQAAKDKFAELTNNPVLKPLFNNSEGGWYKLTNLDVRGGGADGSTFGGDYKETADRVPQVGVRIDFVARVLDMTIPFLGSTSNDPGSDGFSAKITGLMIREPTQEECYELQIKPRYSHILKLDSRYGTLGNAGESDYKFMEDNGC